METQDKNTLKASDALFIVARMWLFIALAALMLAIVVQAIEQHKTTFVITRSYRVPIEREEEAVGNSG